MPEYYHVRISPKRPDVVVDFGKMMNDMIVAREAKWDNDYQNSIKKGDYLTFITGETGNELMYIFKVSAEGSASERLSHWKSDTPYTFNNGTNSVSERRVITLTNQHKIVKTYEWRTFRTQTGLGGDCESWMPRGTQRVVNKKKLSEIFKDFDT